MSASDLTAARLRRPGPGGARILLVAGRSWLTTRASDQERVPVRLLDRLWLSTRRGVELDVVCGVSRVLRMLELPNDGWDLRHYDAVVLLPDPGRSALPPRLQRVIDQVAGLTRVLGVSDTAIRPGEPVPSDGDAVGWEEIRIAPSSRDRSAALVADAVGAALRDVLDHDEIADVPAPVRVISIGEHLQRIALLASTALDVGSVAITLLVAGQSRTLATVGPAIGDQACLRAGAERAMVVLDAWQGRPVADEVRPQGAVRFFAAHPLELADGSTLGTLSVFDPQPRTADEFDADVLHDLAVLTSAELQYAAPRT